MLLYINTANFRISQILGNIFHPTKTHSHDISNETNTLSSIQSNPYSCLNLEKLQAHLNVSTEKPKSFLGKLCSTMRSIAVVIVASIVTSALIASGVGIAGIGIAIGAGILAGTLFGAATNAITCAADNDWSNFWSQTFDDFKVSCISVIGLACGCGAVRLVMGSSKVAAGASASRKLWANLASGVTNTAVSNSCNVGITYANARKDFKEFLKQNNLENSSNEEKARLYQEYLRHNGLDNMSLLKTFGFAILTTAISRNVNNRFQIAREIKAKAALKEGLNTPTLQSTKSVLAENTVLSGVGLTSEMLERGSNITLEEKISTVFRNYLGGLAGHLSSGYVQPKIQTVLNRQASS
ncbi:MAG: hypothetical protein HYZ79_05885 [Candidatus Melainabacteria bacterium]|nr:hypothetical protein [Candidatus Melainabacteria bacterium]